MRNGTTAGRENDEQPDLLAEDPGCMKSDNNGSPSRGRRAAVFVRPVYLVRGEASSPEGIEWFSSRAETLQMKRLRAGDHELIDLAIHTPAASGCGRARDDLRAVTLPVDMWREVVEKLTAMIEAADADAEGVSSEPEMRVYGP